MLTQKVIKGELVIVPDLEYHSRWDFALSLVQPPESILARGGAEKGVKRDIRETLEVPSSLDGCLEEAVRWGIP